MASQEEVDAFWMRRAIDLAQRGAGLVSPNPLVGCVIANANGCIAEGWHHRFGERHAEIDALARVSGRDLQGATMYVTLEPCAHHGKQPPCATAVAATNIARIVVGCGDPNPLVAGKGLEILRAAGKEVVLGVEESACQWAMRYFLHAMHTGMPYITAKIATSRDQKIAMAAADGRWLTSEESRKIVHSMRAHMDAVLVGIGTVLEDDPELNVRLVDGRNPTRIVIDPNCTLPIQSKIARTAAQQRTILVASQIACNSGQHENLSDLGIEVIALPASDGKLSPSEIASSLFQRGLQSILLEGGPVTLDNFMRADIVQEMHIHEAPLTIGSGREWRYTIDPHTWQLIDTLNVGCDTHYHYRIGTS